MSCAHKCLNFAEGPSTTHYRTHNFYILEQMSRIRMSSVKACLINKKTRREHPNHYKFDQKHKNPHKLFEIARNRLIRVIMHAIYVIRTISPRFGLNQLQFRINSIFGSISLTRSTYSANWLHLIPLILRFAISGTIKLRGSFA